MVKNRVLISTLFLGICISLIGQEPNEFVRKKVEALLVGREVAIHGDAIYSKTMLPDFYQKRVFSLAWNANQKSDFLQILSLAEEEGLNPEDYHFRVLTEKESMARTPEEKAEVDVLLTDAALLYASHLLNGKVNPETIDSEWKAVRREGNASDFLEKALQAERLSVAFQSLAPENVAYAGLKSSLKNYRSIEEQGGWSSIASGETLKRGMTDSVRVPKLVNRLKAVKLLPANSESEFVYSEEIEQAIKLYQKKNGLEVDGNLGKQTLTSLNVPVQARIDQVIVNMERYRWIAKELGQHYVMVNIADFRMQVFNEGQLAYEQAVIVGKPFRKTPVFSGKMTYMVLNPYWTVPPTILYNDMLPEVKKNVEYLGTKNIKVLQGNGSNAQEVDPRTIDWSKLSRTYFPYTLRQDPGPTNALGAVKFMFPNKYNVYIHDTPSRELFNKPDRAFSSGCIRLNKPLDFARYLLKGDLQWDNEKLEKVITSGKEQTIMLKKPLNVHILYLTAWSENGEVCFRKDIYERDAAVLAALNQPAPSI